jgi:hypothetical protein
MINTTLTVWCDQEGCMTWRYVEAKTKADARVEARNAGWSCRSTFEFCPEHSALVHRSTTEMEMP